MLTVWNAVAGTLLALLVLAAVPTPAAAEEARSRLTEQRTVRDRDGFRVGRIDRKADGDLILRDRHGFRSGQMQSDGRGGYTIRNRQGFRTGRVSPPR
jgi:hypothetical protein